MNWRSAGFDGNERRPTVSAKFRGEGRRKTSEEEHAETTSCVRRCYLGICVETAATSAEQAENAENFAWKSDTKMENRDV